MKWSGFAKAVCLVPVLIGLSASLCFGVKCNSAVLAPGRYHYAIDGRSVVVRVPSGYTDERPAPVLLDLHGLGLNGDSEEAISGFSSLCDRHGFIGVWPSGANLSWNYNINDPSSDLQYIKNVVDYIRRVANVDRSRIYVVGISQGAGMANTLVCEAADIFAAAAPDSMELIAAADQCRPSRPVSVMEWHGYEDYVIPYNGGGVLGVPSAPESLLKWARIMGCTGSPVETAPPDGSGVVETYAVCSAGTAVGLGSIHGGHGLYGQFSIQEYTWAFLTRFTLPLTPAQLDECPADSANPGGVTPGPGGQGAGDPAPGDPGASGGGGGGGGCFIATAVYGSALDPHVAALREFRDKHLLTNVPGRTFVRLYYDHSPRLAAVVSRHKLLRMASRAALDPTVYAVEHPYGAIMMLLSLAWGFVFLLKRRQR